MKKGGIKWMFDLIWFSCWMLWNVVRCALSRRGREVRFGQVKSLWNAHHAHNSVIWCIWRRDDSFRNSELGTGLECACACVVGLATVWFGTCSSWTERRRGEKGQRLSKRPLGRRGGQRGEHRSLEPRSETSVHEEKSLGKDARTQPFRTRSVALFVSGLCADAWCDARTMGIATANALKLSPLLLLFVFVAPILADADADAVQADSDAQAAAATATINKGTRTNSNYKHFHKNYF